MARRSIVYRLLTPVLMLAPTLAIAGSTVVKDDPSKNDAACDCVSKASLAHYWQGASDASPTRPGDLRPGDYPVD